MKRTESEILRDPDIWHISDSDDDFDEDEKTANKLSDEDAKSKRGSDDEAKENFELEEQEMARYLVE